MVFGRHSLYDGILRAAAVLVGERRALVCGYGDVSTVFLSLFLVWCSCVHCRAGVTLVYRYCEVGTDFAFALLDLVLVCSWP